MAVQNRQDNITEPLILDGKSYVRNAAIAQDGSRMTELLTNTIMCQIATTRLWVPFNSLSVETGASVPRGIYVGDNISAADLVDGDIEDVPIMVGGCCTVNENVVVWDDDTLDADTVVNAGTIEARTARAALVESAGIYLEDTVSISEYEN
jgi:hypothetical protein